MLRNFLSGKAAGDKSPQERPDHSGPRIPRHSSGWGQMLRHFKKEQNLRVLDVGPTSSNNINYLTSLGHSVYMADLVEESTKPQWRLPQVDDEPAAYDAEGFVAEHMGFAGRSFDAVLLWDTADYLPEPLVAPVINRIYQVMQPGGLVLAFFHSASREQGLQPQMYFRYHLTDEDIVQCQPYGRRPTPFIHNNRAIEKLFSAYSTYKFLLAKDNMREVIVTR